MDRVRIRRRSLLIFVAQCVAVTALLLVAITTDNSRLSAVLFVCSALMFLTAVGYVAFEWKRSS